jgi:hypothetical protein
MEELDTRKANMSTEVAVGILKAVGVLFLICLAIGALWWGWSMYATDHAPWYVD